MALASVETTVPTSLALIQQKTSLERLKSVWVRERRPGECRAFRISISQMRSLSKVFNILWTRAIKRPTNSSLRGRAQWSTLQTNGGYKQKQTNYLLNQTTLGIIYQKTSLKDQLLLLSNSNSSSNTMLIRATRHLLNLIKVQWQQ